MKLGIVIGKVISTRKEGNLGGNPIFVVSYLDAQLNDTEKTTAAVDTVGAGSGDVVLLCSSSSARLTERTRKVASDNSIIGIVDSISSEKKNIYKSNK